MKISYVPDPVSELVLLQELFGEVLEVSLREMDVRRHRELARTFRQNEETVRSMHKDQIRKRKIAMDSPSLVILMLSPS